jgi:hypothetical protein
VEILERERRDRERMIEEGMGVKKELEEKVRSLHHRLK